MTDEQKDNVDGAVFWSAPAERSGDGAFGRRGRSTRPAAARAKAVSRSACHRTPQLAVLAAVFGLLWAADRCCAQNLARTIAPNAYWTCVACSANGTVLAAAASGTSAGDTGLVYVSANGGATWSAAALPCLVWSSLACSPDGTTLAAAAYDAAPGAYVGGSIYISTNSGKTWGQSRAPTHQWMSVAFSGDGSRLLASEYDIAQGTTSDLYVSVDLGQSWTPSPNSGLIQGFCSLVSSRNGAALAGVIGGLAGPSIGAVYTSTNYGALWLAANVYCSGVAVSADGTKLVAVGPFGDYTSTNSGASWTSNPVSTNDVYPSCCAMSPDGTSVVAAGPYGQVFISTNSGATWTPGPTLAGVWQAVAWSSDGTRLVGAMEGGGIYVSGDGGATWADVSEPPLMAVATSAPPAGWRLIACSADATNLVAFEAPGQSPTVGQIYSSRDRGASWTLTSAPADQWTALASSADGSKLVAVSGAATTTTWTPPVLDADSGQIISSADFGATWVRTSAPIRPWASVACSTNGDQLVAATYDGAIYVSTDSAATWTLTSAPSNFWWAVAISADGGRMAAAPYNGLIYVSTNAGTNWTATGPSKQPQWSPWYKHAEERYNQWESLAMSADGAKLAAVGRFGAFTSADGGATWRQAGGSAFFYGVASSADGTKLAACGFGPGLYVSADSGATWTLVLTGPYPAGDSPVSCVASSADGSVLAMGGPATVSTNGSYGTDNGLILVAQIQYLEPAPSLYIASTNGGVSLSWQVTPTSYVLQESQGLNPANWTDVSLSTQGLVSLGINDAGQNEAVLWELGAARFFRLKQE